MSKNSLKMALATGGLLAGAGASAHATIITDEFSIPYNGDDIYFNLTTPSISTTDSTGYQFHLYGSGSTSATDSKPGVKTSSGGGVASYEASVGPPVKFATNFSPGSTVGSSSSFTSDAYLDGVSGSPFPENGTKGYLGLQIGSDYGWAQISDNSDGTVSLFGFSYDDSGAAIVIPAAVPEPSNAVLMIVLTGATAAVVARRRRLEAANRA